jgi:hypothetical protein
VAVGLVLVDPPVTHLACNVWERLASQQMSRLIINEAGLINVETGYRPLVADCADETAHQKMIRRNQAANT